MDKETLRQYRSLQKELPELQKKLDKLCERLENVPEVNVKVTKSGDEHPYIEKHLLVKAYEPKEADELEKRIRLVELRINCAERMQTEIEQFIARIPDSTDRRIFELTFLDGKKQREVAENVGYSEGRVSQKISQYLKD